MTEFFTTVGEMDRDERRDYLREGIILDVAEQIWAAMKKKKITQKELAGVLGTTPANVSRLLDGSRNMTLRTMSDIADALDLDIGIKLRERATDTSRTFLPDYPDWTARDTAMPPKMPEAGGLRQGDGNWRPANWPG